MVETDGTTIRADWLDAAMVAAYPQLGMRRKEVEWLSETAINSAAYAAETKSLENVARARVRRVVAALNGVDIENSCSTWTEPPALLPRETVSRLKAALLNERVGAAMDDTIGSDAAAELLGEIAAL
jgi:hypothetical protein